MKKLLFLGLFFVSALCARADFAINLGAGMLYLPNGTTPQPTGTLVQLLASTTDNVFTLPTPGSFTGGSADDVVLASFTVGSPGVVAQPITINFASFPNLTVGDFLLLRWYPTLPVGTASPAAGTPFGQFRVDIIENFSTISWQVPADGSINDLNFLTMSLGGTRPESDGRASLVVTAVPEPSSVALVGVAFAGLVGFARRRKA